LHSDQSTTTKYGGVRPLAGEQRGDEQRDIPAKVGDGKLEHRASVLVADDTRARPTRPIRAADGLDQGECLRRVGWVDLVDGPEHGLQR